MSWIRGVTVSVRGRKRKVSEVVRTGRIALRQGLQLPLRARVGWMILPRSMHSMGQTNNQHLRSSYNGGRLLIPPLLRDGTMKRIDTVEYDGVKVVFNYNDFTATVVHGYGSIRVTTIYPLNWVADGGSTLEFIVKIKKLDRKSRQLQFELGLPV
jgi:hypothetical protein